MKAIVLDHFGGLDALVYKDFPTPKPTPGHALIRIKAFGINHAETHMRKGEWPEAATIIGIECVGIVEACPGGEFAPGTKVAALMGGLGRTINGSYAEFTLAPVGNVASIESSLSWAELAAIPETYATAWTCVFRNLDLRRGETLLVRGGTSALGQAAINLAVNAGAKVIATSRKESRFQSLLDLGAARAVLEGPDLSKRLPEKQQIDKVLNLIGNIAVIDSIQIPRRGGRVCTAGWLGGLKPIADFNPMAQMAVDVHFSLFGSWVFGEPQFPLSDVPLQSIASDVAAGKFTAKPVKVFGFDEIHKAHKTMEESEAGGKMVVVL